MDGCTTTHGHILVTHINQRASSLGSAWPPPTPLVRWAHGGSRYLHVPCALAGNNPLYWTLLCPGELQPSVLWQHRRMPSYTRPKYLGWGSPALTYWLTGGWYPASGLRLWNPGKGLGGRSFKGPPQPGGNPSQCLGCRYGQNTTPVGGTSADQHRLSTDVFNPPLPIPPPIAPTWLTSTPATKSLTCGHQLSLWGSGLRWPHEYPSLGSVPPLAGRSAGRRPIFYW